MVDGIQLDMAPEIGPLATKTIVIDKNDNAEGIVQFSLDALTFVGECYYYYY